MSIRITAFDDPAEALQAAHEFLVSEPVHHNLILTLLHERVAHPQPGHYWVASEDERVVGFVFQSPLSAAALVTPMATRVVEALVDSIAGSAVALPAVHGEATAAAAFAGYWTERCKSSAVPVLGMRIYELIGLRDARPVEGALRQAGAADRELLIAWITAFHEEIHEPTHAAAEMADRWLAGQLVWLWDVDGNTVSMAVGRTPVAGAVRVSHVYTPPELRGRGYAAACVHGLSKALAEAGYKCMLYTDLGNPTSNSIYRQIGYRAVGEALRYKIG